MEWTDKLNWSNRFAPKDGRQKPFKVEHFRLEDDERDTLRQALKPYAEGGREAAPGELGAIFKDKATFPHRIIKEMEVLREEKGSPVIFAIHNFYEFPRAELETKVKDAVEAKLRDVPPGIKITDKSDNKEWVNTVSKRSYMGMAIRGLSEALGLQKLSEPPILLRREGKEVVDSNDLHKDGVDVTLLAGVLSNGAPTRFIDWRGVLEEASANPELRNLEIMTYMTDSSIGDFTKNLSGWESGKDLSVELDISLKNIEKTDPKKAAAFSEIVKAHSFDVEAAPGVLLAWANDGKLLHQAKPGRATDIADGDVSRAIAINLSNR